MSSPTAEELCAIIRRTCERGMKLAHDADPRFVDTFQHILDELSRLQIEIKQPDYPFDYLTDQD